MPLGAYFYARETGKQNPQPVGEESLAVILSMIGWMAGTLRRSVPPGISTRRISAITRTGSLAWRSIPVQKTKSMDSSLRGRFSPTATTFTSPVTCGY